MLGKGSERALSKFHNELSVSGEARQELMYGDKHVREVIYEKCMQQGEGFNLLTMGRPEGPGCFCGVNELLKYGIDSVATEFDVVLIDCEAGPEQVSRRVTRSIDELILVIEPTVRSVQTALYIREVAEKVGVRNPFHLSVVLNKERTCAQLEPAQAILSREGIGISGIVPFDDAIAEYDAVGKSIFQLPEESASVKAVERIVGTLFPQARVS